MAPFETSPDDLSVVDELKRLLTLTTHQRVIQMLKIEIESLTQDDILTHMGLVLRHVDSGYVCGSAELLEANETVVNLFTGKDVNAVWDPFSSKWRYLPSLTSTAQGDG
eukprot:gene10237-12110_t